MPAPSTSIAVAVQRIAFDSYIIQRAASVIAATFCTVLQLVSGCPWWVNHKQYNRKKWDVRKEAQTLRTFIELWRESLLQQQNKCRQINLVKNEKMLPSPRNAVFASLRKFMQSINMEIKSYSSYSSSPLLFAFLLFRETFFKIILTGGNFELASSGYRGSFPSSPSYPAGDFHY